MVPLEPWPTTIFTESEDRTMPEDTDARSPENANEERRGVLNLRTQGSTTTYANIAVVTTTPEEVVISFGINVNPPGPQREVNVEILNRTIMTYPSAKRLALTLSNVLQRYEARRGPIDVGGRQEPAV
jgi:hypothetical protein